MLKRAIRPKKAGLFVLGMPRSPFLERLYRLLMFLDIKKINTYSKIISKYDMVVSHLYPMNILAKKAKKINKKARMITSNIFKTVQILEDKEIKKGKKFGKVINSIQEIALNSRSVVQNCYDHIDNNHSRPYQDEYNSLIKLYDFLNEEVEEASKILSDQDFASVEGFKDTVSKFRDIADSFDLTQVSRIKNSDSSARNSLLYLRISSDTENISLHILNLVTALKSTFESFNLQAGEVDEK